MSHPFHPIAATYPLMSEDQLADLTADIESRCQVINPVWMYNGQVIDGRNRWLALERLGVDPREWLSKRGMLEHYTGPEDGLLAFVESLNEHRRHLTPEFMAARRRERIARVQTARAEGKSIREIAEAEDVSIGQVQRDLDDGRAAVSPDTAAPAPAEQAPEQEPTVTPPAPPLAPEPAKVSGQDGKAYPAQQSSGAEVDERRKRVLAAAKAGKTTKEIAKDEGVALRTIQVDLKEMGYKPPKAQPKPKPAPIPEPEPAPEPAAPPPYTGPVDGLGVPIDERRQPAWEIHAKAKEAMKLLRQVGDLVDEMAKHPGGAFLKMSFRRTERTVKGETRVRYRAPGVDNLIGDIKGNMPWVAVCPYCQDTSPGQINPQCRGCKGQGWGPKSLFDRVDQEMKDGVLVLRVREPDAPQVEGSEDE